MRVGKVINKSVISINIIEEPIDEFLYSIIVKNNKEIIRKELFHHESDLKNRYHQLQVEYFGEIIANYEHTCG